MATTQNISEIDAAFLKAEQFRASGKKNEALQEYSKVVYFAPDHWPAYFHLGVLLGEQGHHELAVSLLKRSAAIRPDNAVIRNHIADHLLELGFREEAIESLEKSWAIDPSHQNISALLKIGRTLWESNRFEEAITYFTRVMEDREGDDKDSVDRRCVAQWFRALCKLSTGDYQSAWEDYECRNDIPGVIVPRLKGSQWKGESLKGKTIFLAYEQRFGDFIQFARFLPRLTRQGARVIVQVPPELERQLALSFPEVELVKTDEAIPAYDYYHYVTSIPSVLGLSKDDVLKDPVKYLDVKPEDRKKKIAMRNGTRLKVGLVWQGKPDPDRGISLKSYLPLLKHRTVSFYSFQLGEPRKDLFSEAVGWLIRDLGSEIEDFYDSSVLLKQMDLLITIDTAIAHQAGALGVPVWVMLRHFADWRWETGRSDNVWYPTMRLFRQEKPGCWEQASRSLARDFDQWVKASSKK